MVGDGEGEVFEVEEFLEDAGDVLEGAAVEFCYKKGVKKIEILNLEGGGRTSYFLLPQPIKT